MARSETERALATTIATLVAACKRKDELLRRILENETIGLYLDIESELDREGI